MDEINVIVVNRGRKYLYLRYTDPVTGQDVEKSARTASKREAIKRAGEWQAEVIAGGGDRQSKLTWSVFRDDFFENYVNHRSVSYSNNVSGSLNIIEDAMKPDRLNRITTEWIKRFKTQMVKNGKTPATLHKYLQHLKTALKWAVEQGYLNSVPVFPKNVKQAGRSKRLMKGRPITLEEFERMLSVCQSDSINYLMRGLWLSGLRLGEALALTWDQWEDGIRIQIDSDGDVCLMIDGGDQKNGETQLYPVVDDFAEFLLATPPVDRTGFVFNPANTKNAVSRRVDTVSNWIVAVGEKAGVKVDQKTLAKKGEEPEIRNIYASAHDFRRAFGTRWASIVPPMVLRDLMRHSSVETTEKFYININAKKTVEMLRQYKQASDLTLGLTLSSDAPAENPFGQQKH